MQCEKSEVKRDEIEKLSPRVIRIIEGSGVRISIAYILLFLGITVFLSLHEVEITGIYRIAYSVGFVFFIVAVWLAFSGLLFKSE